MKRRKKKQINFTYIIQRERDQQITRKSAFVHMGEESERGGYYSKRVDKRQYRCDVNVERGVSEVTHTLAHKYLHNNDKKKNAQTIYSLHK